MIERSNGVNGNSGFNSVGIGRPNPAAAGIHGAPASGQIGSRPLLPGTPAPVKGAKGAAHDFHAKAYRGETTADDVHNMFSATGGMSFK